jgi:hypothetical protein
MGPVAMEQEPLDSVCCARRSSGGRRGAKRRRSGSGSSTITTDRPSPPVWGSSKAAAAAAASTNASGSLEGIPRRCHWSRRSRWKMTTAMATVLATATGTVPLSVVDAAPYDFCYQQLLNADTDINGEISTSELGVAVAIWSGGLVSLDQINTIGSGSGSGTTTTDLYATGQALAGGNSVFTVAGLQATDTTHQFCTTAWNAILTVVSTLSLSTVDTSDAKCRLALTIGDANRDSQLERNVEFPRYANQVSGNAFGFGVAYDALPGTVQNVYTDFADAASTTGTIAIAGSKASETPTADQATLFRSFCQCTGIAILASSSAVTAASPPPAAAVSATATLAPAATTIATTAMPMATPPPAPTNTAATVPPPPASTAFTPTYTYAICLRMIAFSDTSRDNALDATEYYAFVNRLSNNYFAAAPSYETLPNVLRITYTALTAGASTINVFGSKPGQTASADDTVRLEAVCTQTDMAIQTAQGSGGSTGSGSTLAPMAISSSTPPPAAAAAAPSIATATTPPPMATTTTTGLPYDVCVKDLLLSDLSRDSRLDESEFVRWISRHDAAVTPTTDFATLSPALQAVFAALATTNRQIDVTGSKPNQQATPEQQAHLESICLQVGTALGSSSSGSGGGTTAPVAAPPPPPTTGATTGPVTIFNAFVVSNAFRLLAAELQPGTLDRQGLQTAYATFVDKVMANYTSVTSTSTTTPTSRQRRNLRIQAQPLHYHHRNRRRLPVTGIQHGASTIYQIRDSTCPSTVAVANSVCQTVYASFVANYEQMDSSAVLSALTQYTQERIVPLLLDDYVAAVPNARFHIEGPTAELVPSNSNGNGDAPVILPPANDSGGGPQFGRIIGFAVIILFVVGGAYYGYTQRLKTKSPTDAEKDAELSVNEDDEVQSGYGVESAPTSPKRSRRGGDRDSSHKDESEGGTSAHDEKGAGFIKELATTAQDQQEKVQMFITNKLRIGKKKNSSVDDDIGILENSGEFELGVDDFGHYAFDEPYELVQQAAAAAAAAAEGDHRDGFGATWTPDRDWGGGEAWDSPTNPNHAATDQKLASQHCDPAKGHNEEDDELIDCSDASETESSGSNSDFGKVSVASGASGNVGQLEGFVDNGDWAGVMQTAAQLDNNLHDSVTSAHLDDHSGDDSHSESESSKSQQDALHDSKIDASVNDDLDDPSLQTSMSLTPEELRRREIYKAQVEELVRKAAPDEIDNISTMMDQFAGREAELINTLQTMYERTASQRRLKAVHKSKAIPERDTRGLATGGAEGSAVIAAASMITPEIDPNNFEEGSQFEGSYESGTRSRDKSGSGSRSGSYSGERSFNENEEGSRQSEGSFTGSYSRSQSGSFDDDKSQGGSFTGSRSGSYYDNENEAGSFTGSRSGSYDDNGEGSFAGQASPVEKNNEEGSFTGSQSGSYGDDPHQEGSFTGSRSGSFGDDPNEQGSFTGSQSDGYDDEESQNHNQNENFNDQYDVSFTGSPRGHLEPVEEDSPGRSQTGGCEDNASDQGSYTGSHTGSYDHHNEEDSSGGNHANEAGSIVGSRSGSHADGALGDEDGSFTGSGSYEDDPHDDGGSYTGSGTGSLVDHAPRDDDNEDKSTGIKSRTHDERQQDGGSFTGSRSGNYADDPTNNDEGSFTGSRSGSHAIDNPLNDDDSFHGSESGNNANGEQKIDDDGSFTGNQSGSHADDANQHDEGSFTGSRSGSYGDDHPHNDEGSFSGSRSGSHADDAPEGSFACSRSGSYGDDHPRNDEGSFTGSGSGNNADGAPENDEGSFAGSRSGSYRDDHPHNDEGSFSGSRSGSLADNALQEDEGSYTGSRSGSYADDHPHNDVGSLSGRTGSLADNAPEDDAGSFTGSRSRSHADDDQHDDEGSFTGSQSGRADGQYQEGSFTGSQSGSLGGEPNEEGSVTGSRSGNDERDENYDNDNGSFTGSNIGSFEEGEGSPSGGHSEGNEAGPPNEDNYTGSCDEEYDQDYSEELSPSRSRSRTDDDESYTEED